MRRLDIMAGFGPQDVRLVSGMLQEGAVGIMPTDTVYGLAALATDEPAVARVLDIKRRPADKPLPVQVGTVREADLLADVGGPAAALAERFWPGPLTMVLPRRPGSLHLPFQLEDSVALRVPDEMFCLAVLEHAGWLVVPSANRSGAPAPVTLREADPGLLEAVDFAVDAGACAAEMESTVVDLTGEPRVVREGAVSAADIYLALGIEPPPSSDGPRDV